MVYAHTRAARAQSIQMRFVIPPAASFAQTSAQSRPPPGMEPPIPASPPVTYQFSFGMQPQPPVPKAKARPTKMSRVTTPPPIGEVKNTNRIPLISSTRCPFSQQNNQQLPPNQPCLLKMGTYTSIAISANLFR
jgi:hypothetical protein